MEFSPAITGSPTWEKDLQILCWVQEEYISESDDGKQRRV